MRLLIPIFSPATGTWGGLTRLLAVAGAARQAGHSVAFCASGHLAQTLRVRGYPVYFTPPPTLLGLPPLLSHWLTQRSQNAALPVKPGQSFGSIWLVQVLSGMARPAYLRALVAAQWAAAQDFQADGLVTDLDLGAYLLAEICGFPVASMYQQIMTDGKDTLAWKLVQRATNAVLAAHRRPNVAPDELAFGPRVLKIVPSIPELEGADANRPDICYVGSLLGEIGGGQPDEFRPKAGQRYLFVYTGTGSVTQRRLREVLPRLLARPAAMKAIVGGANIAAAEQVGNVTFQPYVSADTLLPHCAWCICHGGQNTIIQSLRHGVPLLVFPGPIFERRFNGRKVQEAGAGLMGEIPNFEPEWLLAALEKQDACAANARELGEKIQALGGAVHAVEAIAAWLDAHKG